MGHSVTELMADERRSLTTRRERQVLSGDVDASENYERVTESRVRSKIEGLEDELALLDEHRPELAELLRSIVCGSEESEK